MKKILLLSDTHSYIDDRIIDYAKSVDEVWHAGDIGDVNVINKLEKVSFVRAVFGNIDGQELRLQFKEDLRFSIEGLDIYITHIGGYPRKYNLRIKNSIENNPPDIFICGHSHILKVMPDKKNNLLHLNPGAIGKHGFHKKRTMLRFVIEKGKIKDLEVIEFNK